jgi:hypothetical protein
MKDLQKTKMNLFKNLNENIFSVKKNREVEWFDREGIYNGLGGERLVSITLDEGGTRYFNCYVVSITHKISGLVVKKIFRFQDYLTMDKPDFCHIWYDNGELDWYVNRPTNMKEMIDRIFDWIDLYQ